jgi:Cellulase (glycosyl hydrolase family 5)
MGPLRVHIDGRVFRDSKNREVNLRGINCAADAKLPSHPNIPSHEPSHFFDGDSVSFKERPFAVGDAHTHFTRLKRFGYNTIRYIFTWEAIEHECPGKYDEEWIAHTIDILRVAKEYGFYIFLDPHQDVWSRFSGGSGSPMWTLYAAGLDPRKFQATEAAISQNTWPDGPENFPKMVWATNYTRLACQVMFTAFFAGRDFMPRAKLNGKNIQDYLQDHYIGAMQHFAKRIREAGDIERDVVIGWESWNEPNSGLIGREDLSIVPASQSLKNHTSPTPFQAMLLGSGRSCEVDTYAVGSFGPYKTGTTLVDPKGEIAWLPADYDDSRYGWKRDPEWKLGECIWAQHGVWDPANDTLLKKDYFAKIPSTKTVVNEELWMNHYFMNHWRDFRKAIKEEFPDAIMFCQPTPFEIPPNIKGSEDDTPDLVYTPHFYDGITLMTKKWYFVFSRGMLV